MSGKKAKEVRQEVQQVAHAQQAELKKLPEELRNDIEQCVGHLNQAQANFQQAVAAARQFEIDNIGEQRLLKHLQEKAAKILQPSPLPAAVDPPELGEEPPKNGKE